MKVASLARRSERRTDLILNVVNTLAQVLSAALAIAAMHGC